MTELLQRHPLSAAWGDMPEDQYREFVESVREHGVTDPLIVLLDGKVLDGWHRHRAAVEVGIDLELVCREFLGDDPVAYVIRRNGERRHLTAGQRAICVAKCYEWRGTGLQPGQGRNEDGTLTAPGVNTVYNRSDEQQADEDSQTHGSDGSSETAGADGESAGEAGQDQEARLAPSSTEMANELGVSRQTVQQAKAIIRAGLDDAVMANEMPFSTAAQQAKDEPDKPRPPTRTEKLETLIDALKMEVDEKAARIEELEEQVRFLKGELSEYPHEREATFNRQQAVINAQRAELATERSLHNELKRSHRGALRRIKELEGQPDTPVEPRELPVEPVREKVPRGTSYDPSAGPWDDPAYVESLPPDDQPEGRDSGDGESDPWEEAQRVGPFRIGEYVMMPSGDHGVLQGQDSEGRALVSTEYGVGRILPFDVDQLHPEA